MKLLILTIITGLFLYGCQDDFEDHSTEPKQSITLKNYSLKEANKIPQFKIANSKARNELRKTRKSSKSCSSRASGDFIAIDSSTVSEISFDDFKSYTMLIEKEEDSQSYFENLVIHVKEEVVTEVFTVKYTPTQAPVFDETSKSYTIVGNIETNKVYGISTLYTGNGTDVDPDPSGGGGVLNCIWVMMCNGRNGGGVGQEHRSTQDCHHSYLKRVCDLNMPVRSSCNAASNYNTGNGHGGSGTGSGSNNITTNNPITTPVIPKTPEELKSDIFKMEFYDPLIQSKKDFLTSNGLVYKEIKDYVTASINLNNDGDYIPQDIENFALELIDILQNMQDENLATKLEITRVTIYAKNNNYFNQNLDTTFFNNINGVSALNFNTPDSTPLNQDIDPLTVIKMARLFLAHCVVIKDEHPDWSQTRIFAQAWLDTSQLMLDIVGLVPVYGEVADLLNGIIYTITGQSTNALLSFSSTIPIGGWFASGAKMAKRADGLRFLIVGLNNTISFGAANSKKFRATCGLIAGDLTRQAHHIIPRGSLLLNNEVVQRAATEASNQGFHIDSALNGIAVATWRNQPNHNNYNNLILKKLDKFYELNPNATPLQCYNYLTDLIGDIKHWIVNNPNSHLNNLVLP
ncbi:AHH domain-containing protein [Flavobacterium sp.]|uniref:AHH domain-containing protein n=1 Tax=Flavobacterium sp. TaxID=239 RepID=UPI00286E49CB|nr:AHH domain-containing protein [Flavobacterium sp.]